VKGGCCEIAAAYKGEKRERERRQDDAFSTSRQTTMPNEEGLVFFFAPRSGTMCLKGRAKIADPLFSAKTYAADAAASFSA